MAFYMQLLFASISLTYTMAQKFALAPDKLLNYLDEEVDWSTTKVCSLNVDEANTWNFGQMLPLILLFQFILAGMGAFYGSSRTPRKMGANNEATLSGIPLELVGAIADHLPSKDVRNLRLASQRLNDGTLATFADRYFRRLKVNLHLKDIQKLEWAGIESADMFEVLINDRIEWYKEMNDQEHAKSLLVCAMAGLENLSAIHYHQDAQEFRWQVIRKLWEKAREPELFRANDWIPVMEDIYKKRNNLPFASAEYSRWSYWPIKAWPSDATLVLNSIIDSGIACSSIGFFCGLSVEQARGFPEDAVLEKSLLNLENLDLTLFGSGIRDAKPADMSRFAAAVPETLKELRFFQGKDVKGRNLEPGESPLHFPLVDYPWVNSCYEKALDTLRCRRLRKLDVCIPGSALPALIDFIRRNKATLRSISVSSLNGDWSVPDSSSGQVKLSRLLKTCLEVEHLEDLALALLSGRRYPGRVSGKYLCEKNRPHGFKMDLSPVAPEREALELLLRKWQALECLNAF
ncbi:hypothetical protein HDK77DRAFT_487498 [Phyllosticta capitalensis]